jgi:DNA-binding NarL/FixJ family response regulator
MPGGEEGLLERAGELDALSRGIDAAARGRGSVLLIEGPAGVGKTSLVRAAGELAGAAGLTALTAIGGIIESDIAWNLVRQLFEDVVRAPEGEHAELLGGAAALAAPALGLERGSGAEAGALHGLYWLTAALAERRPLLIGVDDAQWGDDPSLRYLAYISRRVEDLPVCVVASARTGEDVPEPLAALQANPAVDTLSLRELSPEASAELTRRRLGGGAADEFCSACHRATQGNPFLLESLLAELRREEMEPSAGRAPEVARATPETVRRTVLLGLSRLPPAARELALATAVLGGDARLAEAGKLAGLAVDEAARAADSLAGAAILAPGSPLAFRHPLVREVVYGEIPAHARGRRHREAAEVLAAAGAAPERVQAQLLLSDPAGDPWVVERLREGVSAPLLQGAPRTAADLLARALREPPPESDRAGVLAELGRVELLAGRPGAAEHLRQAVGMVSEPEDRARVALDLGRALYVTGRPLEAAAALESGLAELTEGDVDDFSLAAELRASWLAVARTELALRERAAELAREIAADPPRGDSYGERALLAQVAGELTFAAEPRQRALELAHAALGGGELIREETSDGLNWLAAMGALGWGHDFDAYDALQYRAQLDARRRGSVIGLVNGSYGLSFSYFYRGRLPEAIAAAQQAIDAEPEGWVFFLPAARAQLAWSLIERGEFEHADAELVRAERDPNWEGSSMQTLVFEARARLHLARGEPELALKAALAAGQVSERALIPNPAIIPWRSRAAMAAARLNRRDQARALIDEGLELARRFGAPRPIGVALIAAATVRGAQGIEALEEAVEVLSDSPARLVHARAVVALGAALRRRGRLKEARELLRSGLDEAMDCGSAAIENRARAELIAAGARPNQRRSRGTESLTPAELRVAELAADGMTNREIAESLFVSLRTVETHLTHTYRKLEIDSREALSPALKTPA